MRFEQRLVIRRPPDEVFDYVTDPANLAAWQTHKTHVEPLTDGPPGLGTRIREWTKPVDGTWTFSPEAHGGTGLHCVVEGELRGPARFFTPFVARGMARQFRGCHDQLRKNVESA